MVRVARIVAAPLLPIALLIGLCTMFGAPPAAGETIRLKNGNSIEGEILSNRVLLEKSRKNFERNDRYIELGIALDDWYAK